MSNKFCKIFRKFNKNSNTNILVLKRYFNNNSSKSRKFSYYGYCIPKKTYLMRNIYGKNSNEYGFAGEDSYFTFLTKDKINNIESLYVGIFDGVGSGKKETQNESAKFSQSLTQECLNILSNDGNIDSKVLSINAYNNSMKYIDKGASTVLVMKLMCNGDNIKYNSFNIGDCQYAIFRGNGNNEYKLNSISVPQIQAFGIPNQIGAFKSSVNISNGEYINNDKDINKDDIIVIGSDGLWDNLFYNDIENIISYNMQYKSNTNNNTHNYIRSGDLAHQLIKNAYQNSIETKKTIITPWSQYMTDVMEMVYSGGKEDDITCITVYIH
mmetsp:Transcript_72931/g.89454  ORF Transcript_72931/g.89454 Transcript_72931/m.89454 type:complete len:325 (-) Transcript_72931:81-1055(-)